jgi:hypothetical protein
LVTFSTRDSHEELNKKFNVKPKDDNNVVISEEEYNKDEQKSYVCDVCGTRLEYNSIDDSYWCSECVRYVQSKDVKKQVMFEIPTDIKDITPAITSIDYTLGDTDRVKIDHRPQPKGSFAELQRKGLRITDYREETPK